MIDSNIIERIQKLRAITERRGATEGEAIAAEQRMFRLLAKYNLEISQIPDDEPTKRDTRIDSESAKRPSSVWKQYLYTAVANLNFSQCFTWRQHIVIVGTRANRIATLEMARYLIEAVERLANKEAAEVPGDERRRFRHSYAEGCATRIYERVEHMRLEAQAGRMKAEDPNSLLPALADLYQTNRARVDDFIADHFGKVYHRTHYTSGGPRWRLYRRVQRWREGRSPSPGRPKTKAVASLKDATTIERANHTTRLCGYEITNNWRRGHGNRLENSN